MRSVQSPKKFFNRFGFNLSLKIFLLYLSLSIFLTLIIGIFTYSYIISKFDDELEKYEKGQVYKSLGILEINFREIRKLGTSYALNPDFTQFLYMTGEKILDKYADVKVDQSLLSNAINSNDYIEDIFVYYEKSDKLISYSGLLDLDIYSDIEWKEDYDSMDGLTRILDTRKIESSVNGPDVITFITKLPYDDYGRLGAIVINVEQALVADVLRSIAGDSDSLAFLINGDGRVLSSNDEQFLYGNIGDILGVSLSALDSSSERFEATYEGEKMLCYYADMSLNNWTLVFSIPQNAVFDLSMEIRYYMILVLICLLILVAGFSLIASKKMYRPIGAITKMIKKSGLGFTGNHESDISIIRSGVDKLYENNKSLEKVMAENKMLFREYFLGNVMTGKIRTKKMIMNKADYFQIDLDCTLFCIAAVRDRESARTDEDVGKFEITKISVINIARETFRESGLHIICSQDSNDNILLLVKLDGQQDPGPWGPLIHRCLDLVRKRIAQHTGMSVIMGVGGIYDDVLSAGHSYREALTALRYCFIAGDIVDAANISAPGKEKLFYSPDLERKVMSLVDVCDYDRLMHCINEGIREILEKNRSIDNVFTCLSNLINLVDLCISEYIPDSRNIKDFEDIIRKSVKDFGSLKTFSTWIGDAFRKIIDTLTGIRQGGDTLSVRFRQYVEINYANDLSLSATAKHFGYNASYFSRLFKKSIGVNFYDYISKMRIDKSMMLLSTTEDSIEKIARMVGFNNRSSFIRYFCRYTSITPGEYRHKLGK